MSEHNNEKWLFVSDVDDTLLGDDEALTRLSEALANAPEGLTVTYNSSRPCASLRKTLAQYPHMATPDYLIGAMGTEIQEGATGRPVVDYGTYLRQQGWNRDKIAEIMADMGFEAHRDEYQTTFKASYHAPEIGDYKRVMERLQEEGIQAKVIYSGGKNLDIIPVQAGKGNVIAYLRRRLHVAADRVVVAGDSGNDLEMFVTPYLGIVVANADEDLKSQYGANIYHAEAAHAAGVLEGLQHWHVLPESA